MDIVLAVSNYVQKMVSADGAAGSAGKMKILLLDDETVGMRNSRVKVVGLTAVRFK